MRLFSVGTSMLKVPVIPFAISIDWVEMSRISSFVSALLLATSLSLVTASSSGASQFEVFYAFPTGSGTTCTTIVDHCSLETALGLINSYDTVTIHLAETDSSVPYSYSAGYLLDSSGVNLTLVSDGSGTSRAVFDGSGMTTSILTIPNQDNVTITGVDFKNGNAVNGGAISIGDYSDGGNLTVVNSTFTNNAASGNGGAIDAADRWGSASLSIVNSTFTNNIAGVNGGAIDIGDFSGRGSLSLVGSHFTNNSTTLGNGGAIDAADGEDNYAPGSAEVTIASTVFTSNVANDCGGAITSANGGLGTLDISNSLLTNNTSQRGTGGAISAGDGSGSISTLNVDTSIFAGNNSGDFGGAIANGDNFATSARATIMRSGFAGNVASGSGAHGGHEGGAISNGTYGGHGVLNVSYSTFEDDGQVNGVSAEDLGGEIFNGSLGTAALWRSTVVATSAVANALYTRGSFWLAGNILALTNSDACHVSDGTYPGSATFISGGYNVTQDPATSCVHPSTRDRVHVLLRLSRLASPGELPDFFQPQVVSPAFQLIPANATFLNNAVSTSLCGTSDQVLNQVASGERCNAGSIDSVTFGRTSLGSGPTISQFARGSAVLTSKLRTQISVIAKSIVQHSVHAYVCVGYTDILGGANLNASLSFARARAVQQYLHQLLVARGRGAVQIFAYGAGVNPTAPHSASSRKVVVSLLG